ncbi:hypothetical protein PI95_015985 [Hassallia byssoidea VB512170]|uniref:Uncharacterized protein n=1 Tax=Hassallia byssoidea VB512170 TaxID=1304833 RepID=A0A846H9K8_9CYAN|nr:hypothetical protein [Hassalia byssoidea]NEU74015.1 hypothetical protein [Hassalia byssoidea VB512170]
MGIGEAVRSVARLEAPAVIGHGALGMGHGAFFPLVHASRYNGGNLPSGSPVACGGKPSRSAGLTATRWLPLSPCPPLPPLPHSPLPTPHSPIKSMSAGSRFCYNAHKTRTLKFATSHDPKPI